MRELVDAVKAYAGQYWNDDGWDIVVEAFDDEEVAEAIGSATDEEEAIANVRAIAKTLASHRDDIRAEIF
jgi:hypothetical protein